MPRARTITTAQAAKLIGCLPGHVSYLVKAGEIPSARGARSRLLLERRDVMSFLARRRKSERKFARARELIALGLHDYEIVGAVGVSREAVKKWRRQLTGGCNAGDESERALGAAGRGLSDRPQDRDVRLQVMPAGDQGSSGADQSATEAVGMPMHAGLAVIVEKQIG